ncbi:MAG: hypothetical protein ACREJ3_14705 [Polyangiaceae bacterium]
MPRRSLAVLAGLLPLAASVGCSLVYTYGAIQEKAAVSDASADSTTPASEAGTDAGNASDAITSPDVVADSGGVTSRDSAADAGASIADAGPDVVDAGPLAPVGAVVVAGSVAKGLGMNAWTYVLSVLDPTTGHELSRENMAVVGMAYDGLRDVWYIFEDLDDGTPLSLGPYPGGAGDREILHVRHLDTHTGAWTELTSLPVPVLLSSYIAPLTDRLAYVAYADVDAGGGPELVSLDTTNPAMTSASLSDSAVSITPMPFSPVGIMGTRAALTGAVGGTVELVQNTATGTSPGSFQFFSVKIGSSGVMPPNGPFAVAASVDGLVSAVGTGSYLTGGSDLFAVPDDDAGAVLRQFDPVSGTHLGSDVSFGATTSRFRPLAVSECAGVTFVAQLIGTLLYAVPIAGGTPLAYGVSNTLSNVVFEPYTNSVITTVHVGTGSTSGSWEINALALSGTATAPALKSRAASGSWSPPSDLEPTTIAVRQPVPFSCP